MARSFDLDTFLSLAEADVEDTLHTSGTVEVKFPGGGPSHAVLSGNGDGYEAEICMGDAMVAGVSCSDVPTLLSFLRQSRL